LEFEEQFLEMFSLIAHNFAVAQELGAVSRGTVGIVIMRTIAESASI
jgi:hypothetical protein